MREACRVALCRRGACAVIVWARGTRLKGTRVFMERTQRVRLRWACGNAPEPPVLHSDIATVFVLIAYESFHARGVGGMWACEVRWQASFEVIRSFCVAEFLKMGDLAWGPGVQSYGTDLRNVGAQFAVNATACHADKYTEVRRGPTWVRAFTIRTVFVFW